MRGDKEVAALPSCIAFDCSRFHTGRLRIISDNTIIVIPHKNRNDNDQNCLILELCNIEFKS